jgi:hypothetical protein
MDYGLFLCFLSPIGGGILLELCQAAGAAEIMGPPLVLIRGKRFRILRAHAADRVGVVLRRVIRFMVVTFP